VTEDRLFTAFAKIVRRVLTESDDVDFRALYPAKIVKWQSDGVNPSGTVDVLFDDQRLAQKSGAVILPAFVGNNYVPKQGTRVLVGWQGGDERYPYIAGWLGSGGGGNSRLVFVADRTNIGVDADSDTDKVATKQDVQNAVNSIVSAFNGHVHAAGALVAPPMGGPVTGSTAGATAISGSTTISGSPNVYATKP